MNEKTNEFERQLQARPVRPLPAEWRAEILSAARAAQPASKTPSAVQTFWLSTINQKLSTLLWPNQKAWSGLAAVWVVILVLNHSAQDNTSGSMAKNPEPPSPEMIVELRKQQKIYAELTGIYEPKEKEADRPRETLSRPRTWRIAEVAV